MKIWHVRAAPNPFLVDGVSRTVWLLSVQQARQGHEVSLILDAPPSPQAIAIAGAAGMRLHAVSPEQRFQDQARDVLDTVPPEIVHMHSVFIPRQAVLARLLRQRNIPYVVTPHAGLAPQVLARGRIKKTVYSILRERPRLMNADAIALVTPAEEKAVRSYLPDYKGIVQWMPNPVEFSTLDPHCWRGIVEPKRMVFLGRFDVLVKGIDILIEIARLLPELKVDLYGTEERKTLRWLQRLRENLPANVEFHDPVFGQEKARILSRASLYIQPSRWEGFPVSVAECLYLGVPSLISEALDLAGLFRKHELGLVLSLRPEVAARQIREALGDPTMLQGWSERGRKFAIEHFSPESVARNHIELYQRVISRRRISAGVHAAGNGRGWSREQHTPGLRRLRAIIPVQLRDALKQNVSRAIRRSSSYLGAPNTCRSVVLCYHSINRCANPLSIDPKEFRKQILALKEMGFTFATFADFVDHIIRWGSPQSDVAVLTFDDGFEDNATEAAPILADLQVPATFFITSGLMQRDASVVDRFQRLCSLQSTYLCPQQIRELKSAGFEIGAHSHTHANLSRLSLSEARWEIAHSKNVLEDAISAPVMSFAYPFGKRHIHYSRLTIDLVRESGYRGAAAVAFRSVTSRSSVRIYEIPRFFITQKDTLELFRQKIDGHFDWLGSLQELSPAWVKMMVSPEEAY